MTELNVLENVRFEVSTAVTMKDAVFWDVAPFRSRVNRRFGGTYNLNLQGRKIRERGTSVSRLRSVYREHVFTESLPSNGYTCHEMRSYTSISPYVVNKWRLLKHKDNFISVCSHLLTLVPRSLICIPWRWRWYVPPKRRFTQDLHGATSQKTAFFFILENCHLEEKKEGERLPSRYIIRE
jgi:hypothetical protein